MPRWKDEKNGILETSGERQEREENLFENNQVFKFMSLDKVCDENQVKYVLKHFYGEYYQSLDVNNVDARNLFMIWCLGEKNMSPADIKNMDLNAAKNAFNDFINDLGKHPIAANNGAESKWYGEMFGKALSRIKNLSYPTQEDVSTPEGLAAVRGSEFYLMGCIGSLYSINLPGCFKKNNDFNNALDKHISHKELDNLCYSVSNYVYMIGNATNMASDTSKRLVYKVMLEHDIAPLFEGKKCTDSVSTTVGVKKIPGATYIDNIIEKIDQIDLDEIFKNFPYYDVQLLFDNKFSKIEETEPFIADKMANILKPKMSNSKIMSKHTFLRDGYYKNQGQIEYGIRADDFERKIDEIEEQQRKQERDEYKKFLNDRGKQAAPYRKEIFALGDTMSNLGEEVSKLPLAQNEISKLPLNTFVRVLLDNKELMRNSAKEFDRIFSKLAESQKFLYEDNTMKSHTLMDHFTAYSSDGHGMDILMREFNEAEGNKLGLSHEEREQYEKTVILYFMANEDFRVDYKPLVLREDGTIYVSEKSFPVAHKEVFDVKQPTDEEIKAREDYSIKAAIGAEEEREKENRAYQEKRENSRRINESHRDEKRKLNARYELIKTDAFELSKEDFYKKAYENGWRKEEDEEFLTALASFHISERKKYGLDSFIQKALINKILNTKLSEKNHYEERGKIIELVRKDRKDDTLEKAADKAIKSCQVKAKFERLEDNRREYDENLNEENPVIREFLIASYGACFNKDGTIDEVTEKMRGDLYKERGEVTDKLTAYKERIMAIPAENRSAEQEKSYQAALKYDAYQKEIQRDRDFPKRMANLGWYSGKPAKDIFVFLNSAKKFVTDKEAYGKLLDAFEKGEHIDNPGVKIAGSPDAGKLTVDMMNKAKDIISAGQLKKDDRYAFKDIIIKIDELNYIYRALPWENNLKRLKDADFEDMGRKADTVLGNMGDDVSDEYKAAVNAVKALSEFSNRFQGTIMFNYTYFDSNCEYKNEFMDKLIDMDEKLSAYLNSVNGEDPEMLVIWSKFSPEKAAVYADKMPAPKKEEVKEEAKEDNKEIINEQQKDVIVNKDNNIIDNEEKDNIIRINDKDENIIENNDKNEKIIIDEDAKGGMKENNIIDIQDDEIDNNINNKDDDFEVIDEPELDIPTLHDMAEEKQKLFVIKWNLARVEKAYSGHTNTGFYNRLTEKLQQTFNAQDQEEYAELRKELGETARKYLDHTGLKKASHTNSEIRRKCAFLIMAITDDPMYANYAHLANKKRDDEDKISLDVLENMPGVGKEIKEKKTRVSIHDLADEQNIEDGKQPKESRSPRVSIKSIDSEQRESNASKDSEDSFIARNSKGSSMSKGGH